MKQHINYFLAGAILLCLCFYNTTYAQFADCDPDTPAERYRSRDFFAAAPIVVTDVPYGNHNRHVMDIYLPPTSDTETNRPLVIWAHGGGFVTGDKGSDAAVLWCTQMAKMGYVAASINYRLSLASSIAVCFPFIGSEAGAIRGVYVAIQDARSAVRFFKNNASFYGINPNKVFFSGSSAGGVLAANVAYMEESERPTVTTCQGPFCVLQNLGCIDCGDQALVDNSMVNGDIDAGVTLWGAVEDFEDGDGILDIIDDFNDADNDGEMDTEPMLFLHGGDDEVVLPGVGKPFQNYAAIINGTLPDLYGTYPIRQRLASLGANAPQWEAHVLCSEKHGFHIDEQDGDNGDFGTGVPDENFDYVMNEAVDHLFDALDPASPMSQTPPISSLIEDPSNLSLGNCDNLSKGTYAATAYSTYRIASPTVGATYCWDITKGTILTGQGTSEITVRWSAAPNLGGAGNINDAVGRSGTILCYEKTISGGLENVAKASQFFATIVDGPSTAPIANFSASLSGTSTYNFTDISTNATEFTTPYTWDFGDGTQLVGTTDNPSHTYNMIGNYTVKLTAMNLCGNRSDYEQSVNVSGITVAPKVYLQGPFNGTDMNTDLNTANLIPNTEPYTALGFTGLQNAGTGFSSSFVAGTGGNEIVDWVLVELRDIGTASTVIARRTALLQKDGDVVDIDGTSPVGFIGQNAGMYYVVVRHRNHLGVMTGMPVNLN